jgi:hypothetical protein
MKERITTILFVVAVLGTFFFSESPAFAKLPLCEIPGLESITFYEKSSQVYSYTYMVDSSALLNRLPNLGSSSYDFKGVPTEYYDVFYSDDSGNHDPHGEYVTIEAVFSKQLPAGGGLNICGVRLNFSDGRTQYATEVPFYRTLGNNGYPDSVEYAVDGNLNTCTTMGNTVGQTDRLALTLGFPVAALKADVYEIHAQTGGTVHFTLEARSDQPYRDYLVFGSVTGSMPGIYLPDTLVKLPINWDIFSLVVITYANSSIFENFKGSLDASCLSNATLNVGPMYGISGFHMFFAYALAHPWDCASNPISIEVK